MRGVKKTQLICKKTGNNSIRKEEPDNCKLEREKQDMFSRRTGNDYPAACFEIFPKAMRSRCSVYRRGPEATASWSTGWSVEIERVRQEDMLSSKKTSKRLGHGGTCKMVGGIVAEKESGMRRM